MTSRAARRPAPPLSATSEPDELLRDVEVADRLGVSRRTLREWRYFRSHLPFVTVGGRIRYRRRDVEAFLERNTTACDDMT